MMSITINQILENAELLLKEAIRQKRIAISDGNMGDKKYWASAERDLKKIVVDQLTTGTSEKLAGRLAMSTWVINKLQEVSNG